MQWENLTATEFEKAVRETGVCVVPMAVLEKHSEHLPLGTDLFLGHKLACLAAEQEPAVVFPAYYFGKVYEAMCHPGAVAVQPRLLFELAQNILDEIARNGFRKILIFNAHGGNRELIKFLAQCAIAEERPYSLYVPEHFLSPEYLAAHEEICGLPDHEHAGAIETALALALFPQWVHMDRLPKEPATPKGRVGHLGDLFTGIHWFADFPDHYAGDARSATPAIGEKLKDLYVASLVAHIAAVKADTAVPSLAATFHQKTTHGSQE
jgi:creatinine amidohydrolase